MFVDTELRSSKITFFFHIYYKRNKLIYNMSISQSVSLNQESSANIFAPTNLKSQVLSILSN